MKSSVEPAVEGAGLVPIEYVEPCLVYDNPKPHVHSRHGYHPGLAQLPSGDLIALFLFAEAFEHPLLIGLSNRIRSRCLILLLEFVLREVQ